MSAPQGSDDAVWLADLIRAVRESGEALDQAAAARLPEALRALARALRPDAGRRAAVTDRLLRDGRWMVVAHMEHPAGSGRQACSGEPLEEIPEAYALWMRAGCPECRAAVAESHLTPDLR